MYDIEQIYNLLMSQSFDEFYNNEFLDHVEDQETTKEQMLEMLKAMLTRA